MCGVSAFCLAILLGGAAEAGQFRALKCRYQGRIGSAVDFVEKRDLHGDIGLIEFADGMDLSAYALHGHLYRVTMVDTRSQRGVESIVYPLEDGISLDARVLDGAGNISQSLSCFTEVITE